MKGDQKEQNQQNKEKQAENQKLIMDVMKNDTRFMIHSLLSIFNEMSLPKLSQYTGKAKSTLHAHLKKMINAGLVEEREAKSNEQKIGGIKKKYYKLCEDADEKTRYIGEKCKDMDIKCQDIIVKIKTHIAFTQMKIRVMNQWLNYLKGLLDKVDENHLEEVSKILKEIGDEKGFFTSLSFYSHENVKKFWHKSAMSYAELEKLASDEAKANPDRIRPFYASTTIIPLERVLDSMSTADLMEIFDEKKELKN